MITKKQKLAIDKLRNWEHNPRTITPEGFNRLKAQIQELGEYKPLLVTENGEVIGGNMRLRAYKELGYKECWVSVVNPKSEEEKLKYALSDNDQVGTTQGDELAQMISQYEGIDLTNYAVYLKEPTSISQFLDQFKEVVEDEVPEVPTEAESKLGEVYQLGRHRLMCGDSIKIEDVEKLMDGKKADMVFTDPPYGIDYSGGRTQVVATKTYGKLMGDKNADITPFIKAILTHAGNKDYYICLSPINLKPALAIIPKYDAVIVWKKNQPGLGYQWIRRYCEFIIFNTERHKAKEANSEFDHWEIATDLKQDYEHGTQKPVALSTRAIKFSSVEDDIVLDLFGGSGSTLIACEQTNRTNFLMEIDNKYIDVIIKRWMKFTGKRAYKIKDAEGNQCNTLVKFADESFMGSKTLLEDSEVQSEELQNTVVKNVGQ